MRPDGVSFCATKDHDGADETSSEFGRQFLTKLISIYLNAAMSLTDVISQTSAAVAADPANGRALFRVDQELVGVTEVHGTTGSGHRVVIDEPAALGGANAGANPVPIHADLRARSGAAAE